MSSTPLLDAARSWAATDPEEIYREQLSELIERKDEAGLRELFERPLRFGTAGLRGKLGPGPSHMNRALVRRISVALARELRPADGVGRIVVGGDARHGSAEFVEDSCRAFASEGWSVERFEEPVPTPLVAFAALHLSADLAVVVTASHNPPEYNGYKVYGSDGAQILPPVAETVSATFDALEETPTLSAADDRARPIGPELRDAYLRAIHAGLHAPAQPRDLRVVYTPLHGVGGDLMRGALAAYPELSVSVVEPQFVPDPDFPTVRFPNPEEAGALDLALELANREDAQIVLANDPDADRLAVAARDAAGRMRLLSGNELGVVLADYLLECTAGVGTKSLVMTTVVSSRLLSRLAAEYGADYAECLTGFKWIAHGARVWEESNSGRFLFGYEEALGYSVGTVVRDKDGIGAAIHLLELASIENSRGRTLLDRLEDIHRRHGWHRSRLVTLELPGSQGVERMSSIMGQLRERPPRLLADDRLTGCIDYEAGHGGLPPTNLLEFDLGGMGRMLVRPSGTEPKLKFYLERWSREERAPRLDERLLTAERALREEFA